MSNLLLVDDNDPIVQYSRGWDTNHAELTQAVNYTTHCTSETGSSVSLSFNGTGIQVMSIVLPDAQGGFPDTLYAIDGRHIQSISAALRASEVNPFYNDSIFKGVGLSPGQHELNITHLNGTNPSIFCLDFFLVESQPTASFDRGGVTVTKIPTPTPTGHPSSAIRAAAVGGSVGGTMGLILIAVYAIMAW